MTGIRDLIKTYKTLAEPDRVAADVIREHQNQHFVAGTLPWQRPHGQQGLAPLLVLAH